MAICSIRSMLLAFLESSSRLSMDTIQYERNLLSAEVVFRKVTPMDCELSYALSFMSAQDLRGKRYGKLEATGKMKKGIVKKKSTQDKAMMRKYRFAVSSALKYSVARISEYILRILMRFLTIDSPMKSKKSQRWDKLTSVNHRDNYNNQR